MTRYREIESIIEVMNIAIARHEDEEEFFLRSAKDPTSEVAKRLFSEIAADIGKCREGLELRRQKLIDELKAAKNEERLKLKDKK